MPKGMTYIIGNELAEMFSAYGMRAILVIFMTQYLFDGLGNQLFTDSQAMSWYHNYNAAARFFSIIAAVIADAVWGKYKTIITASIIYCFGHLTLALFDSKTGLACGLILIAIGSGGVMPCVFAHLGDQFNRKNKQLITKAYGWFYFTINFGSFFGVLLTPYLLERYGSKIAFMVPALLMLIAIITFYQGRKFFITIPPIGWKKYVKELRDIGNLRLVGNLAIIFAFTIIFHALYSQAGSSWVIQAEKMNRNINLGFVQINIHPSQIQAINQVLILIFIPLFSYVIYPLFEKFTKITNLKKIATSFFVMATSFAVIARAQTLLERGMDVGIIWQFWAFVLLTISEVLVMITSIEFCYIYSPRSMKSLVVGFYALSESLGNKIVASVNSYFQDANGNLTIVISDYFWYFTYAMMIAGVLFVIYMPYYKGRVFLQLTTIKEILEVILEAGKRRIALITLSGSFARSGTSIDLDPIKNMKYENTNNYNFLILTKERRKEGLLEIEILNNAIIKEFTKQGLTSVITPSASNNITFTIKSIYSFKSELKLSRQFTDFEKKSFYLYKSSHFKINELMECTKEQTKSLLEISYRHFYKDGIDFLNFTKDLKYKAYNLGLVAFQLHQSAENFYHCALLFLTGDRPRIHKLKNLNLLLCEQSNQFAEQFVNIFPIFTEKQEECFELLENAYLARYDPDYRINIEQLEYLIGRVEKLKEVTERVCGKIIQ